MDARASGVSLQFLFLDFDRLVWMGWGMRFAPCPPPAVRAPPLPAQNAQDYSSLRRWLHNLAGELSVFEASTTEAGKMGWGVRFAQVKEEPAQRAGDTEQNVQDYSTGQPPQPQSINPKTA